MGRGDFRGHAPCWRVFHSALLSPHVDERLWTADVPPGTLGDLAWPVGVNRSSRSSVRGVNAVVPTGTPAAVEALRKILCTCLRCVIGAGCVICGDGGDFEPGGCFCFHSLNGWLLKKEQQQKQNLFFCHLPFQKSPPLYRKSPISPLFSASC